MSQDIISQAATDKTGANAFLLGHGSWFALQ